MEFNSLNLLLSIIIFLIYGSVCVLSIIFTFFLDTYLKINDELNLEFFSSQITNPLEGTYIDTFDQWVVKNNKIIGPILILLSVIDMKFLFWIVNAQ